MFAGPISDREKFRLELEQKIETAKSLINSASAQGPDARGLQTVGAHLADPHAAASAMASAILTIVSAMQEAIAATEFATLRIEAAPLRPELDDLIERLRGIDAALRVVVAAMPKTNMLAPPLDAHAGRPKERVTVQSNMTFLEQCAELAAGGVAISKSALSQFFERIGFSLKKKRAGLRAGASGRGRSARSLAGGTARARSQKTGAHR